MTTASPLLAIRPEDLMVRFSPESPRLGARPVVERRLADLRGCFADEAAYDTVCAAGDNPLMYQVCAVEPAEGDGQLHYGLGILQPGRVGAEYFFTKGHYHARRCAAEIYIGLRGEGCLLLEDEATGEARLVALEPNAVVYVPGHTAHRTINTGEVPLAYLGIYPSDAGHDYGAIAARNFRHVVVEGRDGRPALMERGVYLNQLSK